ncbi:MAG: 3-beta hydroxysteroid dehydrogenase [Lentisphaerae bacterium GWF2_45_14]|nr:MAG: 3-beta hydroxysteroid dehydrogenase [Lentisphaerae bacterium GWF2_45_14]
MKRILITGGAGFVGSNLAIYLKNHFEGSSITALDNLYRKGSELNLPRLEEHGVDFINGDVRKISDLRKAGKIDFLIECSAEPSVLAGSDGNTNYLIETNLNGAINCAEVCRENNAGMIFLSTSRVYPMAPLVNASITEKETRFNFDKQQAVPGLSELGVSEKFPMDGERSLYGATKYSAEIILNEYRSLFNIPIVINRCGVIAGPWQFGKADQGIAAFWTAAHIFKKPLKYIGFGGTGKQVRDFLHIDDLAVLIALELESSEKFSNEGFFNIGGGSGTSASLLELTKICESTSGNSIGITPESTTRYADIPVYISDNSKISAFCGWSPLKTMENIITDIHSWILKTPSITNLYR